MHILVTRFPYESALGGEELHTFRVVDYCTNTSDTITVLTSCKVLQKLFEPLATIVPCSIGKMPVTPLTAIFSVLLFPDIRYRLRRQFKKIHAKKPITHVYCLSLMDKICITPIALQHGCKVVWLEHQYLRRWFQKSPFLSKYIQLSHFVSIVPISPVNRKILLANSVSTDSIKNIINGVNTAEFSLCPEKRILKKVGISARLHPKKGISLLVKAFPAILALHPDAILEISGEGPEKSALQRMCKEFDIEKSVQFTERYSRAEYVQFLQSCSTFVLPSLDESETFGLVVAEAMLSGCSIVLTNVCGISCYLTQNSSLKIVEPQIQNIADALLESFSSSIEDRLINCDFARTHFDENRMLKEYKQLLR